MERAVLKTLVYSDLFDYPLKAWEVHKWMAAKATLYQIEKCLRLLQKKGRISSYRGYYFISGRKKIVRTRLSNLESSRRLLGQAKLISIFFKLIPWIKLVGISGSLAMENAAKDDDIDFFVITQKNRLWLSRLILLFVLELLDKRRRRFESRKQAAGKCCVNIMLEENSLEQEKRDLYCAHEVLQMKLLWQRQNIYSKYLEDNLWSFKFIPNWSSSVKSEKPLKKPSGGLALLDYLDNFAQYFQRRHMGNKFENERIGGSAAYFLPQDNREWILAKYKQKCLLLAK